MSRPPRTILLMVAVVAIATLALALSTSSGRNALWAGYTKLRGRATIEERLASLDDQVRSDVRGWCADAGIDYPPNELALVALKSERVLEIYGRSDAAWRQLVQLPILGASGGPGPKLVEGDGQVPEGLYSVESFNPNSRFHLSLKVGYPNQFDRDRAQSDGRSRLGGDIMIHGGSVSIGCIAIGNPAIERVFLLCSDAGADATRIVIAPCDLRTAECVEPDAAPVWLPDLHAELRRALALFPAGA